jgi:hypothetical protein
MDESAFPVGDGNRFDSSSESCMVQRLGVLCRYAAMSSAI